MTIDGERIYIPTTDLFQIASTARPVDVEALPEPKWPESPGPPRGSGGWFMFQMNGMGAVIPNSYAWHSGIRLSMIVGSFINPLFGMVGIVLGGEFQRGLLQRRFYDFKHVTKYT